MYLIERKPGEFLGLPGAEHTFTTSVRKAKIFRTYDEAKRQCAENEHPIALAALLEGMP